MKKRSMRVFAVLLTFAFALTLSGCGGSGTGAAEPASDDAAVESDDRYADVNPDLRAAGERFASLSEEYCVLVAQAVETGDVDSVMDRLGELDTQLASLSEQISGFDRTQFSDADEEYYEEVIEPAATDKLDVEKDMLGLA